VDDMESSHGDTVSEQRMARESSDSDTVRESSHSNTPSIQWIVSLVAMSKAACAYNSERLFNNRVKVNC
jgi:hypothetical protein